jgi:hypothetical protein
MSAPLLRTPVLEPRRVIAAIFVCSALLTAQQVHALSPLLYKGEPVHPACIHRLVMKDGEDRPITVAVNLRACALSPISKAKVQSNDTLTFFEDDEVLGGGSFGYRSLSQLDNGIYALAIRRTLPDGTVEVSLAAVDLVTRPMLFNGVVVDIPMIELLANRRLRDGNDKSFMRVGNRVDLKIGSGTRAKYLSVDMTALGRARNKKAKR